MANGRDGEPSRHREGVLMAEVQVEPTTASILRKRAEQLAVLLREHGGSREAKLLTALDTYTDTKE